MARAPLWMPPVFPAAMATLVVKSGPQAGSQFSLAPGLNRAGRAPANEIRIEAASISAVHCELWLMKEQLLVRDLGSTNGTFLNGRPIGEAELSDGDILTLGGVEFSVHGAPGRVAIPEVPERPPPPRFTPEGVPSCVNHAMARADFRCSACGEQFCPDCVRLLARRGGAQHAFCPSCNAPCVKILLPGGVKGGPVGQAAGWLAKLTQTLRLKR